MACKKGETAIANDSNRNPSSDDEVILDQLSDGKLAWNIFTELGGRLRLGHEEHDQISFTTAVINTVSFRMIATGSVSRWRGGSS